MGQQPRAVGTRGVIGDHLPGSLGSVLRIAMFLGVAIAGRWVADWDGFSPERLNPTAATWSEVVRGTFHAVLSGLVVFLASWRRRGRPVWPLYVELAVVASVGLLPTRALSAMGLHSLMLAVATSARALFAGAYIAAAIVAAVSVRRLSPAS